MVRYETLLLARTEVTEDEINTLEQNFEKISTVAKGSMVTFDKWGKYRLVYPVNKNSYGVYLLARYEVPKDQAFDALQSIDRFLKIKCNDFILRYVNVKLDSNAPAAYIKPDPLDNARTGSPADSIIKEGKIESLLSSVDASTPKSSRGATAPIIEEDDNDDSDMSFEDSSEETSSPHDASDSDA